VSEIEIVTEPGVYLIAANTVRIPKINEFLKANKLPLWGSDAESWGEELIEFAGRVCYMSFDNPRPGGNEAYIRRILEAGHGSVLEHAIYTFAIEGVSRSLTHELVRHRAGFGFSQLSQRYCDKVRFVIPPAIQQAVDMASLVTSLKFDLIKYKQLTESLERDMADIEDKTLRRKRAREAARSVLPNCTETKIVVTGNARAWRHFIEMRGSIHADLEIQRLAKKILEVLQYEAQHLFGGYSIGENGIETPYRKV
jgi:thymidylate synthase (FAD)